MLGPPTKGHRNLAKWAAWVGWTSCSAQWAITRYVVSGMKNRIGHLWDIRKHF